MKRLDINTHNYESHLIDYVEGDLSPEAMRDVERFLDGYPDLKPELDAFRQTVLPPDPAVTYRHKDKLKRPTAFVPPELRVIGRRSLSAILPLVFAFALAADSVETPESELAADDTVGIRHQTTAPIPVHRTAELSHTIEKITEATSQTRITHPIAPRPSAAKAAVAAAKAARTARAQVISKAFAEVAAVQVAAVAGAARRISRPRIAKVSTPPINFEADDQITIQVNHFVSLEAMQQMGTFRYRLIRLANKIGGTKLKINVGVDKNGLLYKITYKTRRKIYSAIFTDE